MIQLLAFRTHADTPFHTEVRMGSKNEVTHSIALYGCKEIQRLEAGVENALMYLASTIDQLVKEAGFQVFGSHYQRFSNSPEHGFTHFVAIGKSGITFHTWPEFGTVTVCLVTCPEEDDDGYATTKLERLLREYFGAASSRSRILGEVPLQIAA